MIVANGRSLGVEDFAHRLDQEACSEKGNVFKPALHTLVFLHSLRETMGHRFNFDEDFNRNREFFPRYGLRTAMDGCFLRECNLLDHLAPRKPFSLYHHERFPFSRMLSVVARGVKITHVHKPRNEIHCKISVRIAAPKPNANLFGTHVAM